MATTNQPGIVNSWSLLAFAKAHGQMKVTAPMTHVNSETGEEFTATSCAFVHPTEKDDQGRAAVCFVGFSRNLGELSAKEIASKQDDLVSRAILLGKMWPSTSANAVKSVIADLLAVIWI